MSETFAPSTGLTDEEAVRFDDLEKRSSAGLTDDEVSEYERLKPMAYGPSRAGVAPNPQQLTTTQVGHEDHPALQKLRPDVAAYVREDAAKRGQTLEEYLAPERGTDFEGAAKSLGMGLKEPPMSRARKIHESTVGTLRDARQRALSAGGAKGVDIALGGIVNAAGGAMAAPFTALLPEAVEPVVQAPFEALDKYVAAPIGELTGSEAVRAGVNVGVPALAGAAGAKLGKGFSQGRATARTRLAQLAEEAQAEAVAEKVLAEKAAESAATAERVRLDKPPTMIEGKPAKPHVARGGDTFDPIMGSTPPSSPPPSATGMVQLPRTTIRRRGGESGALHIPSLEALGERLGKASARLLPPKAPGVPPTPPVSPEGPTSPPTAPSRGFLEGGGALDRYIESPRKQFGPEGEAVADKLGMVEATARRYEGSAITDLDLAHQKLPLMRRAHAEKKLMDWVEREEPTPAWAEEFVAAARKATEQNAKNTKDAGLMIQDPRSGWRFMDPSWEEAFPHRIKPEIRKALRAENQPGFSGPKPHTEKFMAENPGLPNPWEMKPVPEGGPSAPQMKSAAGFYAGAEKPRVYKIPRDFFAEDTYQSLRSHIHRTSLDAAENKVFNQTTVNPETGFAQKTGGDLQKLYDRLAQREGGPAAEQMKFRVERLLERNPQDVLGPAAKAINRGASNVTTLTKLAGSLTQPVQQLSQLANQVVAGGVGPVAKGVKGMIQKGRGKTIAEARKAGAIQPDSYRRSMDLISEGTGSKFTRGVTAATSATQAPQSWLDVTARGIAAEGAPVHFGNIREALAKGGREGKWAQRQMTRLDIPQEYQQAIRKGEVTPEIENYVTQRWTASQNIESGITEFPRIYGEGITSPRWMPLRQLKSFQIGQTRWFAENVVKEAMHGNLKPLLRWAVVSVPLGEAVMGAKEFAGGPTKNREDWPKIIDDLKKGDFSSLTYRLGQDVVAGGTPGYGGPILAFAMSDADVEERVDTLLRNITPPIVSDAYTAGKGALKASIEDTVAEKAEDAAKRGRVYRAGPDDYLTRRDAWVKEVGEALGHIFPQIAKHADSIRLKFDESYRRKEIQETLTKQGVPRQGRETRLRRLVDAETGE